MLGYSGEVYLVALGRGCGFAIHLVDGSNAVCSLGIIVEGVGQLVGTDGGYLLGIAVDGVACQFEARLLGCLPLQGLAVEEYEVERLVGLLTRHYYTNHCCLAAIEDSHGVNAERHFHSLAVKLIVYD